MSEENHSAETSGGSWREIRQEVASRALSKQGRQRRLFGVVKATAWCALLGGAAWGVYTFVHAWESDRAALASAVRSEKVREIVLITDGVLTQAWVTQVLAIPRGATLMALDLPALKEKLLANGQVRVAVLTRSFPDTLVVTLQERTPLVRVNAEDSAGRAQHLFVARDGVVYEGFNYEKTLVASLPWLEDFRLARVNGRFEPVAGMDAVAALLTMAQLQAPHLYSTWVKISLGRLASRDEIVVTSRDVPEIVFSRKQEYFRQVAQLDYVIDAARAIPESGLKSVNLATDGQVPVTLTAGTPDELAQAKPAASAPQFNLQPTTQRKGKRDL